MKLIGEIYKSKNDHLHGFDFFKIRKYYVWKISFKLLYLPLEKSQLTTLTGLIEAIERVRE